MPDPSKERLSTADRLVIGAGLAVPVLLLALLGWIWWQVKSLEPSDTRLLISADTEAAFHAGDFDRDLETQAFMTRLVTRIDRRAHLPVALLPFSFEEDVSVQDRLGQLEEFTIVARGDVVVAGARLGGVNSWYETRAATAAEKEGSILTKTRVAGHDVYHLVRQVESGFAFVDDTMVSGNSRERLIAAIEQLEGDRPSAPPPAFFDDNGDGDLVGFATARHAILTRLFPDLLGATASTLRAERLDFRFDVIAEEELAVYASLDCSPVERWLPVVEDRQRALAAEAEARGLELDAQSRIDGGRVVTELRLTGDADVIADTVLELLGVPARPSALRTDWLTFSYPWPWVVAARTDDTARVSTDGASIRLAVQTVEPDLDAGWQRAAEAAGEAVSQCQPDWRFGEWGDYHGRGRVWRCDAGGKTLEVKTFVAQLPDATWLEVHEVFEPDREEALLVASYEIQQSLELRPPPRRDP